MMSKIPLSCDMFVVLLVLATAGWCVNGDLQSLEETLERLERSVDSVVGCKTTTAGTEYRGTLSKTGDNKECQRWDQQLPHVHNHPDLEENYCRNPHNVPAGPWCYTKDPNTRWQFCDIKSCHMKTDCKQTSAGLEYDGRLSVSSAGTVCERWDQLPSGIEEVDDDMFPHDGSVSAASNYCRNPTNDTTGPFCYNSQGQKRYCDIKFCSSGVFEYSTPATATHQPYLYLPADRFPTNGNHLIFSAKARNDVHVTLTPSGGDGYEIVIGGWKNTKSVIRKCHHCADQVELLHSPNDENVYKDYWVYYEAGTIQVGTGQTLFNDTFMRYTDPSPKPVSVVGIRSGWGSAADWIFYAGGDCRLTALGKEYAGRTSFTAAGLKCQRWDSQTPISHDYTEDRMFPVDGSVEAAQNFCRNPSDSLGGPWCYQEDGDWNYCDIPLCEPTYGKRVE